MRTLREYEAMARERLDPVHYDYFAGGAGDEVTLRANEASLARLTLLPRVLCGSARRELGVTLLGTDASMPVVVAPTAFHRLAATDGERATVRAVAAADTIMIVSMAATVAVEDIAAEAPGAKLWFQLYIQPDLTFTEAIVRRAEAAGCRALVVTVDSPARGRRERDDRNGFHDLPDGLHCENLRVGGPSGHVRPIAMSPEISWEHIAWLRGVTELPIVLKGVLHAGDARLAAEAGAAGLIVSNHGGRQFDTAPATIDVLPEVVDAAGGLPVLMDGGIRRGTDVLKALALGATAVAIGRPVVWGLAAEGEQGVKGVLERIRDEVDDALVQCGCASVRDLDRTYVRC